MKQARMLGNYVEYLAKTNKLSISDLCEILECEEKQVNSFLKGRMFISFKQISNLSKVLGVSIESLFAGNDEHYNATIVHCMNKFDDPNNREEILDIIDDYVDIIDAINISK